MSRERDTIKRNIGRDEEEDTYNNFESIQGMMKAVKQEVAKEEYPGLADHSEVNELPSESDEEVKKPKKKKLKKTRKPSIIEEEYQSEEEPEDDDVSSEDNYTKKKRKRPTSKKTRKSKKHKRGIQGGIDEFLQREAESDSNEESDEERGEISGEQQKKLMAEIIQRRDKPFNQPSRKQLDILYQTEEQIKERYAYEDDIQDVEDFGEGDDIGQQGRQPSISDPKLWLVKCKQGKEKECVENLMHKYFAMNVNEEKLKILSVFCFDSLKGYIYVEAFKEANVREAIEGISLLRDNSIKIVPLTEMTQVFDFDKIKKIDIKPKQYVRIKTGVYEGDLAQVIHIEDPINRIYIRVIPRLNDSTGDKKDTIGEYNKKITKQVKPRQRLFNPRYYNDVNQKSHPILGEMVYMYNKMSFKDGFLIKSVRAKSLVTEDVVPKIEELKIFDMAKKDESDEVNMDFDTLITAIQDTEINRKRRFIKGDKVKIIKNDLMNLTGKVLSHTDSIVTIMVDVDGVTDPIEIPDQFVIKNFLPGDLIRVVNGSHIGKSGLIVKLEDDSAIIFSEATMTEFKVSCHDLVYSSNYTFESDNNSYYQLGDLVKILGTNTICYVLDVHKFSLRIIDTRSEIKNASVKEVMKVTQKYIIINLLSKPNGIDHKRNPITKDDTVKITSGPYKGKKGVIRNIFRNAVFIYNQDFVSTNGIFVDKSENLEIMGAELLADVYNSAGGKVNMKRIPEIFKKMIGQPIKILKGHYKGYLGVLRKINDNFAEVELSSKNKIVSVDSMDIQEIEERHSNNNVMSIPSTPRSNPGIKTPSYYPQTSNNPSSPGWNASTPHNWGQSPNPNRDIYMSPGYSYK